MTKTIYSFVFALLVSLLLIHPARAAGTVQSVGFQCTEVYFELFEQMPTAAWGWRAFMFLAGVELRGSDRSTSPATAEADRRGLNAPNESDTATFCCYFFGDNNITSWCILKLPMHLTRGAQI